MLEPPINSVFQLASTVLKDVSPNLEDIRDKNLLDLQNRNPQTITYTAGGQTVKLAKSATQQWEVTSGSETKPAEPSAVDDLIKNLKGLKVMGFETSQTPAQGLDNPRSTIELVIEGQVQPIKLSIGGLTTSQTGAYVKNETDGTIAVVSSKNGEDLSVGPMSFLGRELLKFANARASAIEITRPTGKINLARQTGMWKVISPVAGDAEDANVQNLLTDLSNLRGRRVVGPASDAAKYGLDQPAIKVVITEDPPAPPPTTQPTSQPALPPTLYTLLLSRKDNLAYAMVEGGDKICEIDVKVFDDADAEMLKTQIAQLEPSQVSTLAMSGEAEFTFEKSGENWKLKGEETFGVDPAKITELLSAIRDMRAKKYIEYTAADLKKYGLDKPLRTITWQTPEGASTTLLLAANGPTPGEAYASVSTAPDRVLVIKVEDLLKLKKKVQDFQKAP